MTSVRTTSGMRPGQPGCAAVCALTGSAAIALAPISPALAIDLGNDHTLVTETVASRDRLRAYDNIKTFGAERVADQDHIFGQPFGIRFGDFFAYPMLDSLAMYDDNLYASKSDRVSDMRFELSPMLRIQSKLPRHTISVVAGARSVSFLENSDQDYVNLSGQISGGLDIDSGHVLSASASSSIEHEERGDITAPQSAAAPVEFYKNSVSVGITHDIGRLYGTLSASYTNLDYTSVEANDGSLLNQDQRDQNIYSAQLRTGYRISPGYEVITRVKMVRRQNDKIPDLSRDSTGYEAAAGLNMESDPLLRWQLIGGYGIRDFDRSDIESVRSFLLEGRVEWLPTEKMTVYGTVSHKIDDSLGDTDAGRIETTIKASFDYEIYHNLVGHAGLRYTKAQLIGSDRVDTTYEATTGLDYFLSEHWLLGLDYRYQIRDSTTPENSMDRSQIMASVKYRY